MPINVGILNRRGRERRERPRSTRIPSARRARARRNFRENYNANSSLHGYTRNVHRVHSSAEGCYTWSKPTCTVTYIRSSLPAAHPGPPASLSSYRCASVALFAYYWRAACRQQAIEIPSLTIGLPPSLSLCHSLQREKRVPGIPSDKNFNMARREPYRAASTCVIFEFYRMKSRNCVAQNTLEI